MWIFLVDRCCILECILCFVWLFCNNKSEGPYRTSFHLSTFPTCVVRNNHSEQRSVISRKMGGNDAGNISLSMWVSLQRTNRILDLDRLGNKSLNKTKHPVQGTVFESDLYAVG